MELNPELRLAWQFIEKTGTHLFLTGKAGTGKTTFLRDLKERSPKRMVVVAPTGIAAINAGGVTIHSFFQLPFTPFVPNTTFKTGQVHYHFSKEKVNIIRSMDLLVIDEISMVRADLLDAVDDVLRRYRDWDKPFGGVQLLMIGDVQQLSPVAKDDEWSMLEQFYDSPYFFSSRALKQTEYMTIELKVVYRQQDNNFLSLLNKVRENKADTSTLAALNTRYIPNFVPSKDKNYIRLTTHNYQAQVVNDRELAALPTPAYSFVAEVKDTFPEYSYPTDFKLTIKEGAQIMFVKNDSSGDKRYYNGMIGEVVTVGSGAIFVRNKTDNHAFQIQPEEWTNAKYVLNSETKEITEQIEGTFKQYPIRLAWAITIHKSQGLTFEHAIIDAQNSFAHGQTYVALSRCKTLEGLILGSPLQSRSIICDDKVDAFNKEYEQHVPNENMVNELQKSYTLHLLKELYSLQAIMQTYGMMLRLIDEHFFRKYPDLLVEYKEMHPRLLELVNLASRFEAQYTRVFYEAGGDILNTKMQERIHAAATYFRDQLADFYSLHQRSTIVTDNKVLQKRAKERYTAFGEALSFKSKMLNYEASEENMFTTSDYLETKAKILLGVLSDEGKTAKKRSKTKENKVKEPKTPSAEISYNMFLEGMNIEQIASQRGLTLSTIFGHLAPYCLNGQIGITSLVNQHKIDLLKNFMAQHENQHIGLMAIKEKLNDTLSYNEIKLILNHLGIDLYRSTSNS
jgi:hypothetical protein